MKSICVVPIKSYSSRLPNKNFRKLGERPLYQWLIESIVKAHCFNSIYLDSDSEIIKKYTSEIGLGFIQRKPELAVRAANGNHLINYYRQIIPEYDFYFQCHVTSPFLSSKSIKECHRKLTTSHIYDSILTVEIINKFCWYRNNPINYDPKDLPRTQDLYPMYQETSGLYGIRADVFDKYQCRIGKNPYFFVVSGKETIDIDTIEDFKNAEYCLRKEGR